MLFHMTTSFRKLEAIVFSIREKEIYRKSEFEFLDQVANQVAVQTWKNGKIVREDFYHA